MTTAETISAALSYYSNAGSASIVQSLDQRKRAHFFLTKVCHRVWDSAPHWWKLADGTVTLTAGVGTMPDTFAHMGTEGQIYVSGQLYSPLSYKPPDWVKFQIQNYPNFGLPKVYSLYGKTDLGTPKILCWPTDDSTLLLKGFVAKMPELIDAPLAPHATVTINEGNPAGSYTYLVTYVTALGETEGGTASASVVSGGFQISVTSIRTWWGRTVTARNLYRNENGGTQHKLVSAITDNTTESYIDDVGDGDLTANVPTWATAVSGIEIFPEAFHDSAIYDGLTYLLAKSQGDGREIQFDAKWEQGVRRLWEEYQQGQNEIRAFPAFPGFPTGHPIWSRWQPPR